MSLKLCIFLFTCGTVGAFITKHVKEREDIALEGLAKDAKLIEGAIETTDGTGCSCDGYTCGCCANLDVPKVGLLNDTGCVNVPYLPSPEYGVSVTFSLDGVVYYEHTVSVQNPPLVCFVIPHLEKHASICLELYNMTFSDTSLPPGGCVMLEVKLRDIMVEKFDLGCFPSRGEQFSGLEHVILKNDHKRSIERTGGTGCSCIDRTCGCCAHLDVPNVGLLNDTGCVNVTNPPSPEYGVSVTFSLDGVVNYEHTVSVRNPPPVCFGITHLEKYASICLKLYNITFTRTALSGCVTVEVKFKGITVEKFDLGCFPSSGKPFSELQHFIPKDDHKRAIERTDGTGCGCKFGRTCGCCAHLEVPKVKLNDTGCVNVTYLASPEYGVSVTFSLDGVVYYEYNVSVRNPPPVCFGIPGLELYASICLKLYNVTFTKKPLSGCVMVEVKFKGITVEKFDLGCFSSSGKPFSGLQHFIPKDYHKSAIIPKTVQKMDGTGCRCSNNTCGCCLDLKVPEVKLDDTGCVNMTYLPKPVIGIYVTFSLNGIIYYNYTVSVENPPPVCFGIPFLHDLASICLEFYNVRISTKSVSGCLLLDVHLDDLIVKKFDLGCFRIPPKAKSPDNALRYAPRKNAGSAFQKHIYKVIRKMALSAKAN